jgi:hypothetical protein
VAATAAISPPTVPATAPPSPTTSCGYKKSVRACGAFPFSFFPTAPPLLLPPLLCHSMPLVVVVPTAGSHRTQTPSPRPQSCCRPRAKPPAVVRLRALTLTWLCSAEDITVAGLRRASPGPTSSVAHFASLRSTSATAQDRVSVTIIVVPRRPMSATVDRSLR